MKSGFRRAINGGIAVTAVLLIAPPAFAQNNSYPQWNACVGKDTKADARIAACTFAIQSGREKGPTLSIALSSRGAAYAEKGGHDKAIADFNQAIEEDPKNGAAYHNRALSYIDTGNADRAIADYEQVIKLDPKNA